MIFQQILEILRGQKTQTRRVALPGPSEFGEHKYEFLDTRNGVPTVLCGRRGHQLRIKWQVGRTYAVINKRGLPAVWWTQDEYGDYIWLNGRIIRNKPSRQREHFRQMRIRVTGIRKDRLQDITEADAFAEGVASVEEYKALWDSINGKTKGARWSDNPEVWVITFELVKEERRTQPKGAPIEATP